MSKNWIRPDLRKETKPQAKPKKVAPKIVDKPAPDGEKQESEI